MSDISSKNDLTFNKAFERAQKVAKDWLPIGVFSTSILREMRNSYAYGYAAGLLASTMCPKCEGSGESGHTWHDGMQYSTKSLPCPECHGSGVKTEARPSFDANGGDV